MCKALSSDLYCTNFKCPHNLFWEELNLDRDKIQMTDRALQIRNCCCLITNPWTLEEISEALGLTREEIRRSEEEAFRKLQRKVRIHSEENKDIDHKKFPPHQHIKFEESRRLKGGIFSLQNSCGR